MDEVEFHESTIKMIELNAKYINKVPEDQLVYHRFKYCHSDSCPNIMYMPTQELMIKLMGLAYIVHAYDEEQLNSAEQSKNLDEEGQPQQNWISNLDYIPGLFDQILSFQM